MNRTIALLLALLLVGCRASVQTSAHPPPPRDDHAVRSESDRLLEFEDQLQSSRDSLEEAATIRRLQRYLAERELTFVLRAQRVQDGAAVQSPSASRDGVSVRMEIFRGQQPLRTITFAPRDNRNLALLGG